MPLSRELIIDERHAHDILYREWTLGTICIVIHLLEDVDHLLGIRTLINIEVVLVEVSPDRMRQDHLPHTNGTTPANIVIDAYLQDPILLYIDGAQEHINLIDIVL